MSNAKRRHRRRRRRGVALVKERAAMDDYLAWSELHPYGLECIHFAPGVWISRGYPGPGRWR